MPSIFNSGQIRLDISRESSAGQQMIHTKFQVLTLKIFFLSFPKYRQLPIVDALSGQGGLDLYEYVNCP